MLEDLTSPQSDRSAAKEPLPVHVRQFVLAKVPSVLQLEVLLQLFSARPRSMTIEELSQSLRIEPEPLRQQLQQMRAADLVELQPSAGPAYAYADASSSQRRAIAILAALYQARHVSIIRLIYSRPAENISTLADAFRLDQENEPLNE